MHSTNIYRVPTMCQGLFFRFQFIVETKTMSVTFRNLLLFLYTHTHILSAVWTQSAFSLNPSSAIYCVT